MLEIKEKNEHKFILAIHSTNEYIGFAQQNLDDLEKNRFLIFKLEKNLSNNLVTYLADFLSNNSIKRLERISITLGPSNFNTTRQIVVCARILSQQLNCSLDNYSSFQIMAKRIAIENNLILNNQSFWITKQLKRKGIIAGKYITENDTKFKIKEIIKPKLYQKYLEKESQFKADYDIKKDLEELLSLSTCNYNNSIFNSWRDVFPIYPISAIN